MSVPIEDDFRTAYLDYAMSVIIAPCRTYGRADKKCIAGILFTMNEMGLGTCTTSYRQVRAIHRRGDGQHHPHRDLSLYDALVPAWPRCFSLRYPGLVDGRRLSAASTARPARRHALHRSAA